MGDRTCSIHGCDRPARTGQAVWCNAHYARWQRTGDPQAHKPLPPPRRYNRGPKPQRRCSVEGCERPHKARGWCKPHWRSWQTYGDPLAANFRATGSTADRFWYRVAVTPGCWLWTGALNWDGYGCFNAGPEISSSAHRFAYRLLVGPVPDGLELDHLCRTRNCVNPDHLEPVTHAENVRRASLT